MVLEAPPPGPAQHLITTLTYSPGRLKPAGYPALVWVAFSSLKTLLSVARTYSLGIFLPHPLAGRLMSQWHKAINENSRL